MKNDFFDDKYFTGDTYWYFRFITTFFDNKKIKDMKNFPVYGYQFVIIYLKLCCLAVECKGYIRIPNHGNEVNYLIYLSKDIKEDMQIVSHAITYFTENELISIYKKDVETIIFVPFVENNIGRSTRKADKKRISRRRKAMLDGKPEDLGNVMQLESDYNNFLLEGDVKDFKLYGGFKNVELEEEEYNHLISKYKNAEYEINNLSIDKKIRGVECDSDYEYIKGKLDKEG